MRERSEQEHLLLLEGNLTATMISEGLDCLRKATIYQKGFYYQAFYSLAIGIERLLKIILIYQYRASHEGFFPLNSFLKTKGHDLYLLFEDVSPDTLENPLHREVIQFLSDFSKKTRYYNLDLLTNASNLGSEPLALWGKLQEKIADYYGISKKQIFPNAELIRQLNSVFSVYFTDLEGKEIQDFSGIIMNWENRDIAFYGVLFFFRMVQHLVFILVDLELRHDFYPYLREVFCYYRGFYTNSWVIHKKNWRSMIAG